MIFTIIIIIIVRQRYAWPSVYNLEKMYSVYFQAEADLLFDLGLTLVENLDSTPGREFCEEPERDVLTE